MGVVVSRESALGKELARWDTPRNKPVVDSEGEPMRDVNGALIMGMNCVGIEPYPRMLYRANRLPNGKPSAGEVPPHPAYCVDDKDFERKTAFVESFNRQCQRIVHSEEQERMARGQGWSLTQGDALDLYEKQQQELAHAAAQAEFYAKRMSDKAQAEWNAAQDDSSQHIVDLKPKRRGRRPAAVAPMDPQASE